MLVLGPARIDLGAVLCRLRSLRARPDGVLLPRPDRVRGRPPVGAHPVGRSGALWPDAHYAVSWAQLTLFGLPALPAAFTLPWVRAVTPLPSRRPWPWLWAWWWSGGRCADAPDTRGAPVLATLAAARPGPGRLATPGRRPVAGRAGCGSGERTQAGGRQGVAFTPRCRMADRSRNPRDHGDLQTSGSPGWNTGTWWTLLLPVRTKPWAGCWNGRPTATSPRRKKTQTSRRPIDGFGPHCGPFSSLHSVTEGATAVSACRGPYGADCCRRQYMRRQKRNAYRRLILIYLDTFARLFQHAQLAHGSIPHQPMRAVTPRHSMYAPMAMSPPMTACAAGPPGLRRTRRLNAGVSVKSQNVPSKTGMARALLKGC